MLPAFVELAPRCGGLADGVARVLFLGGVPEEGGFQGPGTALFPEGDETGAQEFLLEAFAIFAGEEDGVGGESVFEGVTGRAGACVLGEGSAGAKAVAAGGSDLCG